MKYFASVVLSLLAVCVYSTFSTAAYPDKAITYTIPFGPGGQSDIEARRQQPLLEAALKQKIVVQYKPGGGGSVGWAELVQQKPNGYFMTGINIPHIILQPMARGNAGFATEDIVPVAFFQATPIGLAVLKDSPYKDLAAFIAHAQANPGAMTIGGSGTWSGHHVAHLQLGKMSGTEMTYIPSTGAADSVAQFLGGHVQALWANSSDLVQHADKIRILAYGTKKPFVGAPDVPTFESLGFPLYASIDRGVGLPPGTPVEIVKILEKAFLDIATDTEIQKRMIEEGYQPLAMGYEESKAYIADMVKQWEPIVKEFKKN